jgi:hypothetical protein
VENEEVFMINLKTFIPTVLIGIVLILFWANKVTPQSEGTFSIVDPGTAIDEEKIRIFLNLDIEANGGKECAEVLVKDIVDEEEFLESIDAPRNSMTGKFQARKVLSLDPENTHRLFFSLSKFDCEGAAMPRMALQWKYSLCFTSRRTDVAGLRCIEMKLPIRVSKRTTEIYGQSFDLNIQAQEMGLGESPIDKKLQIPRNLH